MKIYRYIVNDIISHQKQQLLCAILKKFKIEDHGDNQVYRYLEKLFDSFVHLNHDLFVAYANNQIIGFCFVSDGHSAKKNQKYVSEIKKSLTIDYANEAIRYFQQILLDNWKPMEAFLLHSFPENACCLSLCQYLGNDEVGYQWMIRSVINYYLLQDQQWFHILYMNQSFIRATKQCLQQFHISYVLTDNKFSFQLQSPLIDEFDYYNFWMQNSYQNTSLKFKKLNPEHMWTKIYYSSVNPQNNIIMIHGVNSYGATFTTMVSYLLNYGNVILIDLPIHYESKDLKYLDINWNINLFALFLWKWINDHQWDNLILYGHSMGGAIVAILNILLYKRVLGVIIEDGYNGYCSIIKQNIFHMTSNLFKSAKAKKEIDKANKTNTAITLKTFYETYKPITKRVMHFFWNLFDVNILMNIDQAYLLNQKQSLVVYGEFDGVVNATEASKFFHILGSQWRFRFIAQASHSSHEDNFGQLKQEIQAYLSELLNISSDLTFDLNNVKQSINPGSPYVKKPAFNKCWIIAIFLKWMKK